MSDACPPVLSVQGKGDPCVGHHCRQERQDEDERDDQDEVNLAKQLSKLLWVRVHPGTQICDDGNQTQQKLSSLSLESNRLKVEW